MRTALRVFWRNKGFSVLNVAGLSVGLACTFLILIWIRDELAYDRFHENGDRLYRVMRHAYYGDGQAFTWPAIPKPLEQEMRDSYPEVDKLALISWEQNFVFNRGELSSREAGYHAGPEFFEMASFGLLRGDPSEVLDSPTSVAISAELAKKYFGENWTESAMGETLLIDGRQDFTVTGIFDDVPRQSSLRFDFVLPIDDFIQQNAWVENWDSNGLRLLALMKEGLDLAAFNAKIKEVVNAHDEGSRAEIFLQPFADQYLYSRFEGGRLVGGRIEYVRAFGVVALFIILIACINFTNLATARSMRRSREIGVRKALGANRKALAGQFLGESALFVLISFVIALGLAALAIPLFNDLTEKNIALLDIDGWTVLLLAATGVATAILAGLYPAIYLSSFNALKVLRGTFRLGRGGARLRKGLVVFQFSMSILLIVGTITIYRQIHFIQTKNLGLDRANLISIPLEGGIREGFDAAREELLKSPGIASVARSSGSPLDVGQSTTSPAWEGKEAESEILFHVLNVDPDFVETMRMEVVAGRNFNRAFGADSANFVVNQKAAEIMGMQEPVGEGLTMWGTSGTIVGVVEDFHMASLHEDIEPTILRMSPEDTWMLFVRLESDRLQQGIASFRRVFEEFNPTYPFDFRFVDDEFNRTYRNEVMVGELANYFAFLAVFIACLGLFGLAAFTSEQRRKEIGIRKTLGATISNLVILLSKDLVKLVLVAVVITAPVAYLLMQKWLENFAYHISVGAAVLLTAGAISVMIAALTVSYQSIRAALADPIQSLRIE